MHTFSNNRLALSDLAHELGLLLLQVRRETLVLGLLHDLLDDLALHGTLGLSLLLDSPCHAAVVPLESFAELRIGLSLVVKVDGVG